MSQKQPLMQDVGEIEPTAPTMSFDDETTEPGAAPINNNINTAPPAAYAMPNPADTPYAPGTPPMNNNINNNNQINQINQLNLNNNQQIINNQSQQTIQPQQQPQAYQPQIQPIQQPIQPSQPSQPIQPQVAQYVIPSVDNAVAPAAPIGQPIQQVQPIPQAQVIIVPANNGYAQLPPQGQVGQVGYPGAYGRYPPRRGPPGPRGMHPHPPPPRGYDDPCCIYIFAVIALFFPIIGLFAMCCLNCGNGLLPRRRYAYNRLVGFTIIGFIINGIWWYYNQTWWNNQYQVN